MTGRWRWIRSAPTALKHQAYPHPYRANTWHLGVRSLMLGSIAGKPVALAFCLVEGMRGLLDPLLNFSVTGVALRDDKDPRKVVRES
jgi:hypothetical protein